MKTFRLVFVVFSVLLAPDPLPCQLLHRVTGMKVFVCFYFCFCFFFIFKFLFFVYVFMNSGGRGAQSTRKKSAFCSKRSTVIKKSEGRVTGFVFPSLNHFHRWRKHIESAERGLRKAVDLDNSFLQLLKEPTKLRLQLLRPVQVVAPAIGKEIY